MSFKNIINTVRSVFLFEKYSTKFCSLFFVTCYFVHIQYPPSPDLVGIRRGKEKTGQHIYADRHLFLPGHVVVSPHFERLRQLICRRRGRCGWWCPTRAIVVSRRINRQTLNRAAVGHAPALVVATGAGVVGFIFNYDISARYNRPGFVHRQFDSPNRVVRTISSMSLTRDGTICVSVVGRGHLGRRPVVKLKTESGTAARQKPSCYHVVKSNDKNNKSFFHFITQWAKLKSQWKLSPFSIKIQSASMANS